MNTPAPRLHNKVSIITGAAQGIGLATALKFAHEGAIVVVCDVKQAAVDDAFQQCLATGAQAIGLVVDVTQRTMVDAMVKTVLEKFGRIDVLVNNAGITQPVKFLDITGADYDRILDVSLRGTLYASQAVLPLMIAQNSGSIVCISSVSAQRGGGILGGPHYSAAKAGVLGLARAMAREYGGNNIRVNCVTPGLIATDINKGKIPEDKRQAILDGIPLGHIG